MAASLCAALAVLLGAFGAHGLNSHLRDAGKTDLEIQKTLDQWETAVRYHMYHALALIGVSFVIGNPTSQPANRRAAIAGILFLAGIVLFSGGLYGYVLTGLKPLVHIVPLGGVTLMAGWITLAFCSRGSPSAA